MIEKVVVRPAQPGDREAVLAFCERTWQWGDYIGDVWDRWVADPSGSLLVALVGDQVAGVGKVTMLSRAEAWLEGLRVNPAFRGRGVAQTLWHAAETTARKRWARVVRYAAFSANPAIHHLSERFGYRRVARFIEYVAPAEEGVMPERLGSEEVAAAEVLLAALAGLAASGGLYDGGWHCRELRGGRLRGHIMQGEAYVVHRDDRLAALALVTSRAPDQGLRVGFLGGSTSAVAELARGLRALAQAEGLSRTMVVVPASEEVEESLRQTGYERAWDQEVWVYERRFK